MQDTDAGTHKVPFVPVTNARHLKIGQWRELFYRVYAPESSPELNQSNNYNSEKNENH